ncbi:acid protease [Xylaria sp. CBS 124048]|nr:acid protease [Xylaria sp. CBS 124048]
MIRLYHGEFLVIAPGFCFLVSLLFLFSLSGWSFVSSPPPPRLHCLFSSHFRFFVAWSDQASFAFFFLLLFHSLFFFITHRRTYIYIHKKRVKRTTTKIMHLLTSLFYIAYGLLALAAASPTRPLQKRGAFTVERVRNPNALPRNGPRALLKTLRKYRMPVPAGLLTLAVEKEELLSKRALRRRNNKGTGNGVHNPHGHGHGHGRGRGGRHHYYGNGTAAANSTQLQKAVVSENGTGVVSATPEAGDVEYLSPVNIGGQVLNLDFDTGSSDLWVFNTQLSPAVTRGHSLYDPESSSTFKLLPKAAFEIQYGDGSGARGNVGTDTVNVGGAEVANQAVQLAVAVSTSFVEDEASDGLLGLGFSNINTVRPAPQKTFFENLQSDLAEPLFTADLRAGANGAYEFGRVDPRKFTGEMTFVEVDSSNGFWQFPSETFAVDGGDVQTSVEGNQAIADTGTTLLLADPAVVKAYYARIRGAQDDEAQGGFTVPCSAELPDLQLAVGNNAMATVKGSYLNFAPVDESDQMCFGGLQAGESGGLQVYGDIFFKSNFVVFNGGNNTLGFATHA